MGSSPWWLAWVLYAPMAAVGLAWAKFAHGTLLTRASVPWLSSDRGKAFWLGLLLALALSGLTVSASRWLAKHTRWARELMDSLRLGLVGLGRGRMLQLSCLAAVAEELFFRAALQPSVGIMLTSVAFGMVHVSPRGHGMGWSVWAGVMGLAFGLLFEASGHILVPIVAHALINFENMQYICSSDPTKHDSLRPSPHTSWGRSRLR